MRPRQQESCTHVLQTLPDRTLDYAKRHSQQKERLKENQRNWLKSFLLGFSMPLGWALTAPLRSNQTQRCQHAKTSVHLKLGMNDYIEIIEAVFCTFICTSVAKTLERRLTLSTFRSRRKVKAAEVVYAVSEAGGWSTAHGSATISWTLSQQMTECQRFRVV